MDDLAERLVGEVHEAGGGGARGHSFRMKGGGPGRVRRRLRAGDFDVAQLPSQCSPPLWAIRMEGTVESRHASAAPAAIDRIEALRVSAISQFS
jgi:hypothetical protein